ncbi:helix-turn-helix domain-containing protein [Agromyces binzhouensis]|uniref:helix-turn-helix domain-containing protein n=1 Tax=Agromyces binzhouensis TaxID=1817495 RepID=UPI00363B0B7C
MTSEDLGSRLREIRTRKGLTLRSVAQAVGVSASLISQVETGKTQPSVSTLYALVTHLGVSFDELMTGAAATGPARHGPVDGAAPQHPVQRSSENAVLEMENGVRWERLASSPAGPAEAVLVSYEPGASSSLDRRLMRHAGFEFAYIIEGEITLRLEFETYVLGPGDSLQFDSTRPHLYENRGTSPARGVWFVTGRREHRDGAPAAPDEPVQRRGARLSSAVDVLRAIDES